MNSFGLCEWYRLQAVVDSGAAESVAPPTMAPWVKAQASEGSKKGQSYLSASGDRLPNLGEKTMDVVTDNGIPAKSTYQIANVTRALCAVSRVCDKGNTVVFEKDGGYIVDPHGVYTLIRRENNVYMLDTWIQKPSGFTRQC